MNCPNCRHDNANDARFCAQCGAPLTQAATVTPAIPGPTAPVATAAPAGRSHSGLIGLAVVVLLLAAGTIAALRLVSNKPGTPTPGNTQTTARPDAPTARPDAPNATAAGPQQVAQSAGNVIGRALGAGAKGGSDPGKAQDNATQAGPPAEQPGGSSVDASGTPAAADAGQAANAMAGFLGALSSAVGGAHRHDPVDFHALEALLPSSLPRMEPGTPDGHADETMSIKTTSAHVAFSGPDDAHIRLSIEDATAISGLAGLAEMANANASEQGDSYEKSETIDGRSVHEKWDAAARHGELSLSVGQRFAVDVVGDHVDMDALKNALAHIDLAKLESMKDANPVTK